MRDLRVARVTRPKRPSLIAMHACVAHASTSYLLQRPVTNHLPPRPSIARQAAASSISSRRIGGSPVCFFDFFKTKEEDEVEEKADKAAEPTDAELKRLKAEKLALKAEVAALEAEKLQAGASVLRPPSPLPPPPVPVAPAPSPPPSVPDAAVGETVAELCVSIDRMSSAMDLESSQELQRSVVSAWGAAKLSQQSEIASLRRQLDSAVELEAAAKTDEEMSFGETMSSVSLRIEETERSRKDFVGPNDLWIMAENRSNSAVERAKRARALTRATFKFLSGLTAYDEEEDQAGDDAKVAVPGEGLVSVNANRQRLRLLERHEAANCVEYAQQCSSSTHIHICMHTHTCSHLFSLSLPAQVSPIWCGALRFGGSGGRVRLEFDAGRGVLAGQCHKPRRQMGGSDLGRR
jgi:hypothetical protein